ncbi:MULTISPECIES: MFS transporter [unclassified Streptomyces]|uniref:MFS transporter n=1 Tax=unclassified Streptomyces TaxID=2593676 RepID=UPI0015873F49|nr:MULTISPECIES: MFS transporter [unclassified Streptomyces]NUV72489.1 MFS transporter [Streptomyces sp. CAI-121]NUW02328.1 MFS transporter [Streptomyces sp. CAI 127]NUW18502.1 MFS transporter [Streptomyces sp. CAI-68]
MGPWLVPLVLALFTFGTADFVVAGILRELAESLGTSEAAAGQLVTVYSIVYAVSAPLAAVATTRVPRRKLAGYAMLLFIAGNVVAAMAPTYEVLLVSRVVSAIAAAAVTPMCFGAAGTLPPEGQRGKALGMLSGGIMLAQLLGVPLGTWFGGMWGWQASFWMCVVLGVAVLVTMFALLPDLELPPAMGLRDRLAPVTRGPVLRGLSAMMLLSAGSMMMMTYIAPISDAASSVGTNGIAVLFIAAGLAGLVATQVGGTASDKLGPLRTVATGAGILVAAMVGLTVSVAWGSAPLWVLIGLVMVMAFGIGMLNPPLAVWLLSRAGSSGNEVMALNASVMYLGTSLGGVLGGTLLALSGPGALPVLAVVETLLVVLLVVTAERRSAVTGEDTPAAGAADEPAAAPSRAH